VNRKSAEEKLKSIFGLDSFYDDQWETISRLFKGERILLIEQTGYGKSLCFQFPATQFKGTTIVFSPLVALMRDQVNRLKMLGIAAECLTFQQDSEVNENIIARAEAGELKLLYIHPARMENVKWLESSRNINISMVVVDEAHCISTWGHDFIPSYKKIINLVNLLPSNFPVLATTATATKRVEDDVINQIGKGVKAIRGNLLRENLQLYVKQVESEDDKMIWLGKNLNRIEGTGIIYTGTRANTELYANWLKHVGYDTAIYNSVVETDQKKEVEQGLMENRYKCVVSTNALGMGIDKPDLRFIVHTQVPESPVHYYQEIGRAGRDGKPAYIILFYVPNLDNELPIHFIDGGRPPGREYKKTIDAVKEKRLPLMKLSGELNIKSEKLRIILTDLINQKIITEVLESGTKVYEYNYDAPKLDTSEFEKLRQIKLNEFYKMLDYIDSESCRMKFLCNYLGDDYDHNCGKCDNDSGKPIKLNKTKDWMARLAIFKKEYFPIIKFGSRSGNLIEGVAGSYYALSEVGDKIHRCKYEGAGDFPDELLQITIEAYKHHFKERRFDLMLYVPSTISGSLVKVFAKKLSRRLNIPLSDCLEKTRKTKPQKIFNSSTLKKENIDGAFKVTDISSVAGKSILLFDDIYDSGYTIKEIGKLLTDIGAKEIAPLVIAKTVGGDLKQKEERKE
jgi:ATP-dependent DNA helicase RecQ